MKPKERHTHEGALVTEICKCGAVRKDYGKWVRQDQEVNQAAKMLVNRYLAQSTPEERSERATQAVATRWKGRSKKDKSEFMSWMASHPRPGRKVQERCPCGKYSVNLAYKRGHKCSPPAAT